MTRINYKGGLMKSLFGPVFSIIFLFFLFLTPAISQADEPEFTLAKYVVQDCQEQEDSCLDRYGLDNHTGCKEIYEDCVSQEPDCSKLEEACLKKGNSEDYCEDQIAHQCK